MGKLYYICICSSMVWQIYGLKNEFNLRFSFFPNKKKLWFFLRLNDEYILKNIIIRWMILLLLNKKKLYKCNVYYKRQIQA